MALRPRRNLTNVLAKAGLYLLLLLVSCCTLLTYVWMLSTSLKSDGGIFTSPPQWLPRAPTLQWYRQLFKEVNFLLHFTNSLIVSVSVTALSLLLNSMAGY